MNSRSLIIIMSAMMFLGCNSDPIALKSERNYLKGLDLSEKIDRPVFLVFTGYGSGGKNEFLEDFATSSKIVSMLNEEFITIELYTDDRQKIQKEDTLNLHKLDFSEEGLLQIKKARTIGQINSTIEVEMYRKNTQPLYTIIDKDQNDMIQPFGYIDGDRKLLLKKLDEGLKKFRNRKRDMQKNQ